MRAIMKNLVLTFLLGTSFLSVARAHSNIIVKDQSESSKIKCGQERHVGNLTNDLELISETINGLKRELVFRVHFKSCQQSTDGLFDFREVAPTEIFEQKLQGRTKLVSMKKAITYARFFHTHTGSMDQYSDALVEGDQYLITVLSNLNLKKLVLGPVVTSSVYNEEEGYFQEDYIDFGPAKEVFIAD